jgi:glutaminyl-peptide cyclotransferase
VKLLALIVIACPLLAQIKAASKAQEAPILRHTVVKVYPHDRAAFTQGLFFMDGHLWEGTGLEGRSDIRRVELETGKVLQKHDIGQQYFGEGLAAFGNQLFELTWKNGLMFVYDKTTMELKKAFRYKGEGWGLTTDGKQLIMSDGTSALQFLDPATMNKLGTIRVTDRGFEIQRLNELEYIKGEIWANVWQSNRIARIDPKTGRVNSWLDLRGILSPVEAGGTDVLNGIAYDAKGDRIFVTGKFWPKLFEIKVAAR